MTIIVEKLHRFAIGAGGQTYTLTKDSGLQVSNFAIGQAYNVLVSQGNGRNYIVGLAGQTAPVAAQPVPVAAGAVTPVPTAQPTLPPPVQTARTNGQTAGVNDAKGSRILRQGVTQAVASSQALAPFATTADEWVALVIRMTDVLVEDIKKKS